MSVETEGRKDCFVIAVEDGHRTAITLGHEDALDLHAQMTTYYGMVELQTKQTDGPPRLRPNRGFFSRWFLGK